MLPPPSPPAMDAPAAARAAADAAGAAQLSADIHTALLRVVLTDWLSPPDQGAWDPSDCAFCSVSATAGPTPLERCWAWGVDPTTLQRCLGPATWQEARPSPGRTAPQPSGSSLLTEFRSPPLVVLCMAYCVVLRFAPPPPPVRHGSVGSGAIACNAACLDGLWRGALRIGTARAPQVLRIVGLVLVCTPPGGGRGKTGAGAVAGRLKRPQRLQEQSLKGAAWDVLAAAGPAGLPTTQACPRPHPSPALPGTTSARP